MSLPTNQPSQRKTETEEALIEEFNYEEEGKILKYLPSIGYNFITQSPHLSYNTAAIYAAINDQHLKEAKIRSIKKAIQVTFQAELEKLYKLYANLEAEINYYNHALELYRLKQEIFNIKHQQYQNLEIAPLEFLDSQIKIKSEEMKLRKNYTERVEEGHPFYGHHVKNKVAPVAEREDQCEVKGRDQ